jgi:neutral ceramidase
VTLKAGFAAADITPALPFAMGGYDHRTSPAEGVHDPLYARALVLDDLSGGRLGLVAVDLVWVTAGLCETVAARAGWARERLILAATHTHSGPLRSPDWLPDRLAALLAEASASLQPVEAVVGSAPVAGLGTNRHAPDRPGPAAVKVLSFRRPGTGGVAPVGALIQYPCHPTVLGAENLLVSADFPGSALRRIGANWSLYVNGAAGDVSTRFTRRGQDFAEVERMGALLAEAAGQALAAAQPVAVPWLRAASLRLALPLKPVPDPAAAAARTKAARQRLAELERAGAPVAELRRAFTALQGAELEAGLEARLPHVEQCPTLAAWALGPDLGLVTVPGELFFGPGEAVAAGSPFPATWLVGYAGGYSGYFPVRQAYAEACYEALAAPFAPGSGEAVAEAAVGLLQSIRKGA